MSHQNEFDAHYSVRVTCLGTKKRCRKNEAHTFKLGRVNLDFNESEVIANCKELIKTNMKSCVGDKVIIHLNYEYFNNENKDMTCFIMFDERHKKIVLTDFFFKG